MISNPLSVGSEILFRSRADRAAHFLYICVRLCALNNDTDYVCEMNPNNSNELSKHIQSVDLIRAN